MYINLMCIRKTGNTGFAVGSICALYNNVYPSDWTICDGNNNTPDLRGYFIRSSTQDIGIKGGNINNKITIPAIPHTHKTEYYQDTNKEKLCNNSTLFVNDVYVSTASSPADFYHSYPDRWPTNMNTTTPVGKGNNIDISPPYYTLLYIMKFK
jgi:microcystin-dependent protein